MNFAPTLYTELLHYKTATPIWYNVKIYNSEFVELCNSLLHYPSTPHYSGSHKGQNSVGRVPDYMYIEIHKEQPILVFYKRQILTFLVCLYYVFCRLLIFKICK